MVVCRQEPNALDRKHAVWCLKYSLGKVPVWCGRSYHIPDKGNIFCPMDILVPNHAARCLGCDLIPLHIIIWSAYNTLSYATLPKSRASPNAQ